jgi:hypothetical protein
VPPSRVVGASRVSEQHRADTARQAIGAAGSTSFRAILSNAAVASETVPARPVNANTAGQPLELATGQGARGPEHGSAPPPPPDAAQMPGAALPNAAGAEGPAPSQSTATTPTAEPEEPGNVRNLAADSLAASSSGSRNPWGTVGDLFAGTSPDDPDALKESGGPSNWTQLGSPMTTLAPAPSPHVHHTSRTEENPAPFALAAAPLTLGDLSQGEPAGGPAPPAVSDPGWGEASAAQTARGWDHPEQAAGAATETGRLHDNATPESIDPARSQAIAPEPADNGASILFNPTPAALPDMRSTDPGPSRTDPKLVDAAVAAPRKPMTGDGLAVAGFETLSDGGDGVAARHAAPAAAVGAAVASPAPAVAAPANSSDVAAAKLSPPNITEQLFGHLLQSIQNPDHDVVLRLHPPELGDLLVRVAVSGREVSTWFATPQPQVQEAISQAIGQLHADLGNAGYNLAGAWVGADASDPRGRNARLPSPQPRDVPARGERATSAAVKTAASVGSGVSVYV